MIALLLATLAVLAGTPQDDPPPGIAWARATDQIALRTGPGDAFPGLLVLPPDAPVRLGEAKGRWRPVHVPQGYPLYVHADFVRVLEEEQVVELSGKRVNARIVPTTVGNFPVGRVGASDEKLVLLDREEQWVRVLAPERLALWGAVEGFTETDEPAVRADYERQAERRGARRTRAVAAWRAVHPEWRDEEARLEELMAIAEVDLAVTPTDEVLRLGTTLDQLSAVVTWPESRQLAANLRRDFDHVLDVQREVERSLAVIHQQRTAEAVSIAREAKVLSLGLRFLDRGTSLEVSGRVTTRLGDGNSVLYLLRDATDGSELKLSAAREIADLAVLVNQDVIVDGRRLQLASVSGDVLVVDAIRRR